MHDSALKYERIFISLFIYVSDGSTSFKHDQIRITNVSIRFFFMSLKLSEEKKISYSRPCV